ncbi:MAG: DUF333 domain-containing protein [Anaerolineales bacterium]
MYQVGLKRSQAKGLRAAIRSGAPIAVVLVLASGTAGAQQTPNPAAVFCVQQGGRYEIIQESSGARGTCVLPDGRRIDAWRYYREGIVRQT